MTPASTPAPVSPGLLLVVRILRPPDGLPLTSVVVVTLVPSPPKRAGGGRGVAGVLRRGVRGVAGVLRRGVGVGWFCRRVPPPPQELAQEWAKAYARMRRWDEEVQLLEEEFRRLPVSLKNRAQRWRIRAKEVEVGTIPFELAQGLVAYGAKQARMYDDLADRARRIQLAPKLTRGKGRRRAEAEYDPLMYTPPSDNEEADGNEEEDEAGDGEEGDARGEPASDEELVLGGEVDDE
ncbi:hypothetical protein C8R47DRAFT_1071401 [Mycena vitilis]|nr:hypothetical protein C8R47DRAFT_1071401 [Mycena vitilis]